MRHDQAGGLRDGSGSRPAETATASRPDPLAFYRWLAGYPALGSYRAKLLAVAVAGIAVPAFVLALAIVLGAGRMSALVLLALVLALAAGAIAWVIRAQHRLLAPIELAAQAVEDVALERPLARHELPGSDDAAQVLRGVQALAARNAALAAQLRTRGERDELTGLYGRRAGLERAQAIVDRDCRRGLVVRTLVADIDGFRLFNARQGAGAGDAILKAIAARLSRLAGETGIAIRWHGDTFVLVHSAVPGALPNAGELLGRPIVVRGSDEPVTLSIGSAETAERVAVDRLIAEAEDALAGARRR